MLKVTDDLPCGRNYIAHWIFNKWESPWMHNCGRLWAKQSTLLMSASFIALSIFLTLSLMKTWTHSFRIPHQSNMLQTVLARMSLICLPVTFSHCSTASFWERFSSSQWPVKSCMNVYCTGMFIYLLQMKYTLCNYSFSFAKISL